MEHESSSWPRIATNGNPKLVFNALAGDSLLTKNQILQGIVILKWT